MCGELINGVKFNDIEVPEAESAAEFVERIEGFFKVCKVMYVEAIY